MDQDSEIRVATLCGSIKPLFCGVEDFNERLIAALQDRHIDVCQIGHRSWGASQVFRILHAVAAAQPDAILVQYPTEAIGRSLGPHLFTLLQRIAPLVVTLHEFSAIHVLRRCGTGLLLRRSCKVIATSEPERGALLQWYPWLRNRLNVIPVGANVPPREWAPADTPEIVYFGQIRPQKGLEDFFTCRDRLPNARFTIIGSPVPKFAAYFIETAAEARKRAIPILSGLNSDEVSDRLAAAWIALLPFPDGASLRRGSLMAAAACGVPIVTRVGKHTPPDLSNLLTPARSVEEMTALLSRLLVDLAARREAHDRSLRLNKLVGWDVIAEKYIAILHALSGRTSPSGHFPD